MQGAGSASLTPPGPQRIPGIGASEYSSKLFFRDRPSKPSPPRAPTSSTRRLPWLAEQDANTERPEHVRATLADLKRRLGVAFRRSAKADLLPAAR